VNLLPLEEGERINAVLPVKVFEEDKFVFLATKSGTVKKTPLAAFARQRTSGIIAVELRDDDRLIGAGITSGNQDIMLFASSGKAIRFSEQDVRPMGRTAAGVRGLKLSGPADGERLRQADAGRRTSGARARGPRRHLHPDFGAQRPPRRRVASVAR
jgi:DNA gyrase subunit A